MLMTITDGGISSLATALSAGTEVVVEKIVLGDTSSAYTPASTQTAIQGTSVYEEDIQTHRVVDDNKVEFVQRLAPSVGDFDFREVGLLLDDDTLFAIGVLQTATQQSKTATTQTAAGNSLTIVAVVEYSDVATAIDLTVAPADTIPNATEIQRGIIEIADNSEADTGTDDERAMTPAKVKRLIDNIPGVGDATTTQKGIAELATSSETQIGTDTERVVTPKGLSDRTATTTRRGIIEQATNAETQTGTDTQRAVSPANLASRTATETRTGIVELATSAEVRSGTDTSRAVTPAGFRSAGDDRYLRSVPSEYLTQTEGDARYAREIEELFYSEAGETFSSTVDYDADLSEEYGNFRYVEIIVATDQTPPDFQSSKVIVASISSSDIAISLTGTLNTFVKRVDNDTLRFSSSNDNPSSKLHAILGYLA